MYAYFIDISQGSV